MVDKDVVYGKIAIVQRCLHRIRTATRLDPHSLDDLDAQDIFVLNVQRAVQASIDLAAHVIASEGLGIPQELKEHFRILADHKIIDTVLSKKMERMTGFRNVAVHEYQELELEILKSILVNNLKDLEEFYTVIVKRYHLDE